MNEYHKINTIFKRDMEHGAKIMEGVFSDPEVEFLKDNQWIFTEKVDGTNIRVMWNGESVVLGGKTDNAQIHVKLLYSLQALFEGTRKRQLFRTIFTDATEVCLYGEGYGASIQSGGKYIADRTSFVLFDVKIGNIWLERTNVEDIASKFGIKVVPIVGKGTILDAVEMTHKGFISQWGDFISEGLVLRPKVELLNRRGVRVITKIKHKDFYDQP